MMEQIPIIKPIIEYLFNFSLKIKTVNSNYNNRHYFNIKIPFSTPCTVNILIQLNTKNTLQNIAPYR